MNLHHQMLRKLQRRYLIKSILSCIITCVITAALFVPVGLVKHFTAIDLSFLLLPFLGYFVLRFLSRQTGVLIFPSSGESLVIVLEGIALAFWAYFFFSSAVLWTRLPFLSSGGDFLENLSRVSPYLAVFVAGNTLRKLQGPLSLEVRRNISTPAAAAAAAAGWVLIGLGSRQSLDILSASWEPFAGIGLALLIASLVVALSKVGLYAAGTSLPLLSDAGRWLAAGPAGKFVAAALIAVYFIFIREIMFERVANAYLIEWLLFCLVSWRIFEVTKNRLENNYVAPQEDTGWQKHVQVVDDLPDENFNRLILMQMDFVEGGSRQALMIRLRKVLEGNGLDENSVVELLQPIIEHSDRQLPWYAMGFIRRRMLSQNRVKRLLTLEKTMRKINGVNTA